MVVCLKLSIVRFGSVCNKRKLYASQRPPTAAAAGPDFMACTIAPPPSMTFCWMLRVHPCGSAARSDASRIRIGLAEYRSCWSPAHLTHVVKEQYWSCQQMQVLCTNDSKIQRSYRNIVANLAKTKCSEESTPHKLTIIRMTICLFSNIICWQ